VADLVDAVTAELLEEGSSVRGRPAGTPSMTAVRASPCDSPAVRKRNATTHSSYLPDAASATLGSTTEEIRSMASVCPCSKRFFPFDRRPD